MLNRTVKLIASGDKQIALYLLRSIGRRNAFILLFIVVAMSLIDLIGIALIFPFLQVVTQTDALEKMLRTYGIGFLEFFTHNQLILLIGFGLILFYACKTVAQSLLIRIQAKQLARFTEYMTNNVVSHVLNARYSIFQEIAASEIAGKSYSNTVHATLALTALIQAANEGLILALLFFSFLIFKPMLALGAILLAVLSALLLYQIVIRRSAQIGAAQSQIENVRYRLLFSIASAIRDIKIMGLDGLFDSRNKQVSQEYSKLAWRYNVNSSLPRLLIEFIALLAIVGAALVVVVMSIPLKEAGPLLGLIAVATIRAVPAFTRLFGAVSTFRASSSFVKGLIELQIKLAEVAVCRINDKLAFNQQIELKDIGFRYGDKKVLKNVSLQLTKGESIGIVGSSGAGKTTLLDLFTGLQPANEGKFYCDGKPFDPFTSHAIQTMIGYVPQIITLLDETISFNVSFEEKADNARVMQALKMANLKGFIDLLPDGTQTRVGENGLRLSGGQRQRIGIARALYRSPQILIFDEATSSLDTLSEMQLTNEIEKLHGKISTVIVAHRLSTVMACDRIYVLSNGEIENSGTHAELLLTSKIYSQLYASQRNSTLAQNTEL